MNNTEDSTLVYSTEKGRINLVKSKCKENRPEQVPSDGLVRLRREVKGRAGGTVIVVTGIPLAGEGLKELAGDLKKKCGCGGTARDGIIVIQGDHRATLLNELQLRGYRVKLAGG
jgi:translation initiation factor 1